MTGASLQILPLHLSESHLRHVLPLLWRLLLATSLIIFKSTLSIPLILTLYSCTASYAFISGSPGKGDAVSSSYTSPQCWAHSKCSAREEREPHLAQFPLNPSLSCRPTSTLISQNPIGRVSSLTKRYDHIKKERKWCEVKDKAAEWHLRKKTQRIKLHV